MGNLSEEAKLADKVSAHCGISTNATLRVFYALKDLGYEVSAVKDFVPEPKPEPEEEEESGSGAIQLQEDESAPEEGNVSRPSASATQS